METNSNLNELPIDLHLQIFAKHGLDAKELSEVETGKMKLEHCNKLQSSLFRAIKFIVDREGLDEMGMDGDLSNLAGLGMSVSDAMAQELSQMEQHSKDLTIESKHDN